MAAPGKSRWYSLNPAERDVLVASTTLKVLLFPAYRSTDFEVHRNWLAITRSLPLSKWYYDTTSEWTLDYPPFFAYFESFLSKFAYVVDPEITRLDNLNYSSAACIAFQRVTVILSELVLATALLQFVRNRSRETSPSAAFAISASLLLHPGLLIVDHIHFQYNGFLLGILLWAFYAAKQGHLRLTAVLFASLLNFKHIFIYLAPPFVVFLFRAHCFPSPSRSFSAGHFIELATIVGVVVALSFGPFLLVSGPSGVQQIFSRLFPFQRGLNHAYWAGNVWALVSAADRVMVKYLLARGIHVDEAAIRSTSRGLIGDTTFGVVPEITPRQCFGIVLGISTVFATKLWFDPSYRRFLRAVTLSAFTSFLFGWHVHEKAALLFLVPLTLLATDNYGHLRAWTVATAAGTYGLFPLLIDSAETPIKLIYTAVWFSLVMALFARGVHHPNPTVTSVVIRFLENAYLAGFVVLQIYTSFIHPLAFSPSSRPTPTQRTGPLGVVSDFTAQACDKIAAAVGGTESAADAPLCVASVESPDAPFAAGPEAGMQFLPLMLTSVYCSLGISWSFLRMSYSYLTR